MLSIVEFKINRKLKNGEIVEACIEALNYIIESHFKSTGDYSLLSEGKEEFVNFLSLAQKELNNLKLDMGKNLELGFNQFKIQLKSFLNDLLNQQQSGQKYTVKTEAAVRRVVINKNDLFNVIDEYIGHFKKSFIDYVNIRTQKFDSDFINKAIKYVQAKARNASELQNIPDKTKTVSKSGSSTFSYDRPKVNQEPLTSTPVADSTESSYKQALDKLNTKQRIPQALLVDIAKDSQKAYDLSIALLNAGRKSISPILIASMKKDNILYQKFKDYENKLNYEENQEKKNKRKEKYIARLKKQAPPLEEPDLFDPEIAEPPPETLEPEVSEESPETFDSENDDHSKSPEEKLSTYITHNSFNKLKELLDEQGDKISKTNINKALSRATEIGHDKLVELLINAGASNLTSALTNAAINGHKTIVELLLDKGKDKFTSNDIDFVKGHAETNKQYDIVELLKDVYKKLKKSEKSKKQTSEPTLSEVPSEVKSEEKPKRKKRTSKIKPAEPTPEVQPAPKQTIEVKPSEVQSEEPTTIKPASSSVEDEDPDPLKHLLKRRKEKKIS